MPVHRGELLRLVDDQVPVAPVAVGGGPLGDAADELVVEPLGEHVRGDEVGGAQLVGVLTGDGAVVRVEQREHLRGVPDAGVAGLAAGERAEQLDQLVEQRRVRHRPGGAVAAVQHGQIQAAVALAAQLGGDRGQPGGRAQQLGEQLLRACAAATAR